jgi:Zn-dependent peptidase ImmA (M78 family)
VTTRALATQAVRAAARLRAEQKLAPADTACPFDLAERLGISVRFVAFPRLEGLYVAGPKPTILISAERPSGRRRYSCAHEIGHHRFGHGTRLDELIDEVSSTVWVPEEFVANRFAAALLMPKMAVESAFARRGSHVSEPVPESVFVVAQGLGVGYSTLIRYLESTLCCIDASCAAALRRTRLRDLRSRIAGFAVPHDLVVANEHWGTRPIDVEVGDTVLIPSGASFEGDCAALQKTPVPHLVAKSPGTAAVVLGRDRPPTPLRVSRRAFVGLAKYRHLEESDPD